MVSLQVLYCSNSAIITLLMFHWKLPMFWNGRLPSHGKCWRFCQAGWSNVKAFIFRHLSWIFEVDAQLNYLPCENSNFGWPVAQKGWGTHSRAPSALRQWIKWGTLRKGRARKMQRQISSVFCRIVITDSGKRLKNLSVMTWGTVIYLNLKSTCLSLSG